MSNKKRGFTLLLAALIASIVLSFAAAIFSIAQKQVVLASLSQQSQYAFYAADTAAECGLYWDVRFGFFSSSTPSVAVVCDTATPVVTTTSGTFGSTDYTQSFSVNLTNGYCANVQVHKCTGTITSGGTCCPDTGVTNGVCNATPISTVSTQIHADGFNANCASVLTSATMLERSVTLNY